MGGHSDWLRDYTSALDEVWPGWDGLGPEAGCAKSEDAA
jgi:hypothetical protein